MLRALVVLAVIAGCSAYAGRSESDIATASDDELLWDYGKHGLPAVRAEIEKRNLFSDEEWRAIDRRVVYIGMSEAALFASWGWRPADFSYIASGVKAREYRYGSRTVLVINGRVAEITAGY